MSGAGAAGAIAAILCGSRDTPEEAKSETLPQADNSDSTQSEIPNEKTEQKACWFTKLWKHKRL